MGNKSNINAAQILLESYGKDSLSYFAMHSNKKFFFSSTGKSFLSYTTIAKTALVSGDPIGAPKDITLLLKEFRYFTKGARLTSCFVAVNKTTSNNLVSQGYKQLHIGNEAFITLATFDKNTLKKKVRRADRYIKNLGIICKIFKRKDIPKKYLNQLSAVSEEWISNKGGKEKRFAMTLGRVPSKMDGDCEIVLALQEEKVIGYLTFVPVYASKSLSLDATRKKKNTPNGLTEFLLIQALEYFKMYGIDSVSLNFSTFNNNTSVSKKPQLFLFAVIFRLLSRFYETNNLYKFNNKFAPVWRERYMAFEKRRYIPNYVFAIAKVEQ